MMLWSRFSTELVTRLGEPTDPQLQSKVEGFRYFLGLGHVFTDQWEAAAQVFESFLKAHPKSNRYRKVLELHGDTLVQSKRYPEAAEEYKKLLEMKLPETENFPIMEKLRLVLHARSKVDRRRSRYCRRCCRRAGLQSSGSKRWFGLRSLTLSLIKVPKWLSFCPTC